MSTDLLPPAANEKTAFVTVGTTKFEELIKYGRLSTMPPFCY